MFLALYSKYGSKGGVKEWKGLGQLQSPRKHQTQRLQADVPPKV